MLEYAEKKRVIAKPTTNVNGIVMTPLLKCYLKPGLRCTKIHTFIEYTPQNVSAVLYDLSLIQDEKVMKIRTLELLLKQLWNYLGTARMVIRLLIEVGTQKLFILTMKRRIKLLITVFNENWTAFRQIYMKLSLWKALLSIVNQKLLNSLSYRM